MKTIKEKVLEEIRETWYFPVYKQIESAISLTLAEVEKIIDELKWEDGDIIDSQELKQKIEGEKWKN